MFCRTKNKRKKKKTKIISDLFIDAEQLSQKECQQLISEVFKEDKNEFPSYYQIQSFVDVLAEQLKSFNKSYNLHMEQLKNKPFVSVRSLGVEGFINSTRYFTKAAYSKLLNEQIVTHKVIRDYDEKEDLAKGIENLAKYKENEISFDKIDSTLIFFPEGDGFMFKIITNEPKTEEEKLRYNKFVDLFNSQNRGFNSKKLIRLPDYKNFKTQEEFYGVLKEILNIDNPINEKEKKEKELKEKLEK